MNEAEKVKEIERIIEETVEYDAFGLHRVDEAAAEIAKLVDEEFTEAITTALDSYIIQLDAKEAQLAEMREALEELRPSLQTTSKDSFDQWWIRKLRRIVDKALSAAPEVLWAGEAVYTKFGAIRTLTISNMEAIDLEDGQHGRVILVKGPDDVNQKRLTMESKAKNG